MVEKYKYLGVTLGFCLQLSLLSEQLSLAGSRAVGQIIGKTKCNLDLGFGSYSKLVDACVMPVLTYCCGAWWTGRGNIAKLDGVQLRAIKFYCGVPRSAPSLGVLGDSGWIPGVVLRDLETLRLFNQIAKMPVNSLTRQIFEYDRSHFGEGEWSRNARSLCASIGKLDSWLETRVVNITDVKKKLLTMYEHVWKDQILRKSKLDLYCMVKNGYECAPHLKANIPKHARSLISQLRMGTLGLQLERGRYVNISRSDRICKLCATDVEDQLHFLFSCPKLLLTRDVMYAGLPELCVQRNPVNKFQTLCTHPHAMGRHVSSLWNMRQTLLT